MARYEGVSASVIRRLPRYHRFLYDLIQRDVHRISSRELAELMNLTASQIRQDLNCFGGFGQQGIGYNVEVLLNEIGHLLFGSGEKLPTILIGAGRLGTAVSRFLTTDTNGYHLLAVFDTQKELVGRNLDGIPIHHVDELESFCATHNPQVAVLCLPREGAKQVSGKLVDLGIKGFWNFSHYDLSIAYPNVTVENAHLGDSLMSLGYRMRNK